MKKILILGLLVSIVTSSGCGVFRSVGQWNCDRLGMCCFGTQPTPRFSMMNAPMIEDECCDQEPGIIYQP